MTIAVLVFASVLAAILGAYWVAVVVPEQREQAALRQRLTFSQVTATTRALLKAPEVLSGIAPLHFLLQRFAGLSGPLKEMLDVAGMKMTVATFLMLSVCLWLATIVAAQIYFNNIILGVIGGALAACIPYLVVVIKRMRRISAFEQQFPEAIDLIARAMRVGHGFTSGLKMVADELAPPVSVEFRRVYDQQNFGAPLNTALRTMAERIPLIDARFFVTAVLIQRETGGNLSEVLERLATVVRDRFRVKREIRAKSAHGRITAVVLGALPVCVAFAMFVINPTMMRLLFTDPMGTRMVLAAVVLQLIGTFAVWRLIQLDY